MENTQSLSPVITEPKKNTTTFFEALQRLTDGSKITREEWNDKRTYGFLREGLVQIHKAGEDEETFRPWIINDGDLLAKDWFTL